MPSATTTTSNTTAILQQQLQQRPSLLLRSSSSDASVTSTGSSSRLLELEQEWKERIQTLQAALRQQEESEQRDDKDHNDISLSSSSPPMLSSPAKNQSAESAEYDNVDQPQYYEPKKELQNVDSDHDDEQYDKDGNPSLTTNSSCPAALQRQKNNSVDFDTNHNTVIDQSAVEEVADPLACVAVDSVAAAATALANVVTPTSSNTQRNRANDSSSNSGTSGAMTLPTAAATASTPLASNVTARHRTKNAMASTASTINYTINSDDIQLNTTKNTSVSSLSEHQQQNEQSRRLLDLEQEWIQQSQLLQSKEEQMRNLQREVVQIRESLARIEWDMQLLLHQQEGVDEQQQQAEAPPTTQAPTTFVTAFQTTTAKQVQESTPPTTTSATILQKPLQHAPQGQQQLQAPVVWWSGFDFSGNDDEEEEVDLACFQSANSSVSSIWRQTAALSRTYSSATSTASSSVASSEHDPAAAPAEVVPTSTTVLQETTTRPLLGDNNTRSSSYNNDHEDKMKEKRKNTKVAQVPTISPQQQQRQPSPQTRAVSAPTTASSSSDVTSEPTPSTTPSSATSSCQRSKFSQSKQSNLIAVTQRNCKDAHGKRGVYDGTISPSTRLPHGHGKMVYQKVEDDGKLTTTIATYEGEWKHGHYHGQGTFHEETKTWNSGRSKSSSTACSVDEDDDDDIDNASLEHQDAKEVMHYEGQWHMHAKHGRGRLEYHPPSLAARVASSSSRRSFSKQQQYSPARILDGWWDDDVMLQGTLSLPQVGSCYQGTFDAQQRRHGIGLMMYADGSCYHGKFTRGQMQGQG